MQRRAMEKTLDKQAVERLLEQLGFKKWGRNKARPGNGSKYQCFRRGDLYVWLGEMYVERSDRALALDYPYRGMDATKAFLSRDLPPEQLEMLLEEEFDDAGTK
jgi:hypothetical protein